MKKYTIRTIDGTTGIARLTTKPNDGQLVSIEMQDENGRTLQIDGYVANVLDEQD